MQSINLRVNLPGPAATITVEVLVPADVEWLGDNVGLVLKARVVVGEEMERAIGKDHVMKVVAGCSVDIGERRPGGGEAPRRRWKSRSFQR